MPYLRLRDLRSDRTQEFDAVEVRIGRDPDFDLVIDGEGREVVSAQHAKLRYHDASWWIEDMGSRNGTYLGSQRIAPGQKVALGTGDIIGLGRGIVRLEVEAVGARRISETQVQAPLNLLATLSDAPVRPEKDVEEEEPATELLERPDSGRAAPPFGIKLSLPGLTEPFEARGNPIKIGRGRVCDVRPVSSKEIAISRVHAEIELRPDGTVVIRDMESRNGTLLNGVLLTAERVLGRGDRIRLGDAGPELMVEELELPSDLQRLVPTAGGAGAEQQTVRRQRSFGGRGRTAFFTEKLAESGRRTSRRVRVIVWSFVGLLAVSLAGVYWLGERRVQETAAALSAQQQEVLAAQQAAADSIWQTAQGEYARLEDQLAQAQATAAPVAVVESLRTALEAAGERTTALEEALQRAQSDLSQQMAAGDSLQRRAQTQLTRLRAELEAAREEQVSSDLVDSLRSAVRAAEDRATALSSQVRAIKGVNLAAVAQANQAGVGLVTAYFGADLFDGSGFVLTASGYFVTNRHVVTEDGQPADSLFITMADERLMIRSDMVALGPATGPDLAVLRIRNYAGPHIDRVDWTGARARQGEPAALIGFPAGLAAALDRSQTVRTSMSAGVFSKVTPELIQFDGFTVGGSSGSPIFNADGEVVAVHRAGLREAAGLGFAVPIPLLISLLPPDARAELGLQQ